MIRSHRMKSHGWFFLLAIVCIPPVALPKNQKTNRSKTRHAGRDYRLTDVAGNVLKEILP